MHVLVTGATGYIGGRLVPALLAAGHDVRCLARTPAKLADRRWRGEVEVVAGDVLDAGSVRAALSGIEAAYYLVHSMDGHGDFRARDRQAAEAFRDAAAAAGVARIVYLGGLGSDGLSEHLRSRHEVGRVLAAGPVPVTELRAAVIIGSGSASFEMLRNLVDVLPVMVAPRWVETRCQPIAIRDILRDLVAVLDVDATAGGVFDVGGPDVLTYREMMRIQAEEAGLRHRLVLAVPVLTPKLSSLWVGLVTPLPPGLARPLVESLRTEVVVRDDRFRALVGGDPLPFREAVRLALRRVQDLEVATTWATAELGRAAPTARRDGDDHAAPQPDDPHWSGGTVFVDHRSADSSATPDELFRVVLGIGGARGYAADVLWRIRGALDALIGGIGLRRGRRHPDELSVGDALDFWRVEALEPGRMLRLRAEMKLPGEAWLQFTVSPDGAGGSRLDQRARFHPRGLWGRVYWVALLPFHALIFPRLARRLVAAAERPAKGS